MASAGHPDAPAVVAAFLRQYLDDRERGTTRTAADYQRRFAGHEALIADELRRLEVEDVEVASGPAPDLEPGVLEGVVELIRGPVADRYHDEQEIAVGGMGTVLRVWDPSLRRGIAKKVLGGSQRNRATPELVDRFLEEAQVTAQLDHPGIVPVHELGIDSRGRVYFTMSLVRGQNFQEIIDVVHGGRERWTRTRALNVLLRVCEAVAFAHSKGVIHRDLKPANIMVGPFGQTYVLDWGLARIDPPPDAATGSDAGGEDEAVRPRRRTSSAPTSIEPGLTRAGDVVGTPSYMAPEQARGEVDAVGPHSDVYAIGAILYHLLTGRLPYADRPSTTWQKALDATLAGPPTPLRSLVRDVPEELVAIQERAMARAAGDRYASAADLGEDLRAYLETRVVRAHRTGAIAELRKWVARNRTAAVAVAAALLFLVAGLVASWWLRGVAETQAATQRAVLEFLNGDLLAAVAPGAVGKDATMRQVLDRAAENIEGRFPDRPLVEAAIRRTLADTYRRLGDNLEAERHATRAVELNVAHGGSVAAVLDSRRVLAIVYGRQNRMQDAEREDREILALSRSAFGDDHDDTLTAANNLGLILTYLGEFDEAESLLREAFETRRRTLGVDHDHTLASMCNLGLLYYNLGRYTEAEPLIKGELDLCTAKHGAENPGTLVSMNNWANLLQATGSDEEAIAWHERIFHISEKIRGERHPRTLESLLARIRILARLERYDEVRELLQVARERAAGLGADERVPLEIATVEIQLMQAAGETVASIRAAREALARNRRVLGAGSVRTQEIWRFLITGLRDDGQTEAALAEADAATASVAAGTVAAARLQFLRGQLLVDLERFTEAESDLLAAERWFAENLATDPVRTRTAGALIGLYEATGQAAKAAALRQRAQ